MSITPEESLWLEIGAFFSRTIIPKIKELTQKDYYSIRYLPKEIFEGKTVCTISFTTWDPPSTFPSLFKLKVTDGNVIVLGPMGNLPTSVMKIIRMQIKCYFRWQENDVIIIDYNDKQAPKLDF